MLSENHEAPPDESGKRTTQPLIFISIWLSFVIGTLLFGGVVGLFAILREEPLFWQNRGGYPVWLRHLVLVSYYPLLIIYSGLFVLQCRFLARENVFPMLILKSVTLVPAFILLILIVLKTFS